MLVLVTGRDSVPVAPEPAPVHEKVYGGVPPVIELMVAVPSEPPKQLASAVETENVKVGSTIDVTARLGLSQPVTVL